jgi:hypothetical protein
MGARIESNTALSSALNQTETSALEVDWKECVKCVDAKYVIQIALVPRSA